MRLLYIFRSIAVWGGIERVLVDKMNAFVSQDGYDVYILTTDQGDHSIPYHLDRRVIIEDLKINFHHKYRYGIIRRLWIESKMKSLFKQRLKHHIHQIRPDIIICTTSDPIGSIVKVTGDIPLIVESHSICSRTIEYGRFWLLRKLYRYRFLRSLMKATYLVTLTEGDAKVWRRYCPNVIVIPNMLHQFPITPASLNSKHILFVGRLDYQKRPQEALQIWEMINSKYPDWVLDVYGEGEMRDEIERKVANMCNVYLHQPTDNIYGCYQNSSILILTSLFEPFGLVIPESMSCGLPVVAFDCPYGPREIIEDGVNGFLVKDRDLDCFADKVSCLIENYNLRSQMGIAGQMSSKRYAPDIIIPLWKTLFMQCVNNSFIQKKQYKQ